LHTTNRKYKVCKVYNAYARQFPPPLKRVGFLAEIR
jgi:hypothetical protein